MKKMQKISIAVLVLASIVTIILIIIPNNYDNYGINGSHTERSGQRTGQGDTADNAATVIDSATGLPTVTNIIAGEFPSLRITSYHHPFEMDREYWHNGTLSLSNHLSAFEDVDIRLRGRGNSTWAFGDGKLPLRLRFEEPQCLLGSGHIARDWVLIANHFDLTLMRTHLAFYLSSLLDGIDWTPFSRFAHLYINGEYVGLYQVVDERDIIPGRMQLTFDEDPTISEYLFELDNNSLNSGIEGVTFFMANGHPYDIRFPRNQQLSTGHLEYMQMFVENINEVIRTRNFEAISQVMDIPSMIDFYLVQELFKNIDVGFNSVFMQVRGQGENRRMYWGPVWDFDRSAGNMYYWYDYHHFHAAVRNDFFLYLMTVPEIFDLVAARWAEISSNQVRQMLGYITYMVENYQANFERNFERFPIWDADPSPWWKTHMLPVHIRETDSWQGQVEYLLEWFNGRVWWMNQVFVEQGELKDWWMDYLNARVEQ